MANRVQADLAVKTDIYLRAKERMQARQLWEREQYGRMETYLADIGRDAVLKYEPGKGADFRERVARSPRGKRPPRTPFRFMLPGDLYERQKAVIKADGYVVTQVVEEALERFADSGALPS